MNEIPGYLGWTSVAFLASGIAAVLLRARRQDTHLSPPTSFEDSERLTPPIESFQSENEHRVTWLVDFFPVLPPLWLGLADQKAPFLNLLGLQLHDARVYLLLFVVALLIFWIWTRRTMGPTGRF